MKTNEYSFQELIKLDGIKELMINFNKLTGLPLALIDTNGKIITSSDGNLISAGIPDYFLNLPYEDSKILKEDIKSSKEFSIGKYPAFTIINLTVPIYIDDEHMASILIRYPFLNRTDTEISHEQAHFDEKKYLEFLSKVPAYSEDYINKCLDFLTSLTRIMGEVGLEKKKLMENEHILQKHEKKNIEDEETIEFQLNILKNVRHCIIVYDLQGKIIYWNDSAESIYGYSEEEMLGKNIEILYLDHEKQLLKPDIQEIIDLGEYTGEWEGKRKDGSKVIVDIRETVLYDANDKIVGIIGVSKDITQRKKAEEQIEESLEEKEVLLKEIHHRVKNNLQIIYSLLNLQTDYVEGEESLNVLKESQNRVKSMAMVHERLYQSPNLKYINFKEYVENLITDLFYSYGIERGNIKTQLNLEDIKIDIDTAIPCGLIINELVTNSLKYAFPKGKGILIVEMVQVSDYIKLVVADNGIGLPVDIDLENTETLGLKMVNNLVHQLDGILELKRTNGTEFTIKCKKLEYKNRL